MMDKDTGFKVVTPPPKRIGVFIGQECNDIYFVYYRIYNTYLT